MKTFIKAFVVLGAIWLGAFTAQAQQTLDALTQIDKLKTTIEVQIERIKSTRDLTDSKLSLARLRIGEQIERSEQDLGLQMEQLERLKEQLQEQQMLADKAVNVMKTDVLSISTTALGNIDEQLKQTINLLEQMKKIREEITGQKNLLESLDTTVAAPSVASLQPSVSPSALETMPPPTLNQEAELTSVTINQGADFPTTQGSPTPTPPGSS
jgi:guanyl-specific ribonuclease Sa